MHVHHALLSGALSEGTDEFRMAVAAAFEALERQHPKLVQLASRVCGGRHEAMVWFVSECATLGARVPLQLLLAGQYSLVLYALSEIELANERQSQEPGIRPDGT